MSDRPIADYALLSDCNGSALISTDGSLDWLCLPRFDSRSVFARLLTHGAGHWSIRPSDTSRWNARTSSRRWCSRLSFALTPVLSR